MHERSASRERVKTRMAAGQVQLLAQPVDGGRHSEGLRELHEPGAGTGLQIDDVQLAGFTREKCPVTDDGGLGKRLTNRLSPE